MGYSEQLCTVGSPATRATEPNLANLELAFGDTAGVAIFGILKIKNGFYAFDNALHVFSDLGTDTEPGIYEWNGQSCWKSYYGRLAPPGVCFAEDAYGNQFCWLHGKIRLFNADTGLRNQRSWREIEIIAESMEEWAEIILQAPTLWTGQVVAQDWQKIHSVLRRGHRLLRQVPFQWQGERSATNVESRPGVEAMRRMGEFAVSMLDGSSDTDTSITK